MKKYILYIFISICFISSSSYGQEKEEQPLSESPSEKAVKIYSNFYFLSSYEIPRSYLFDNPSFHYHATSIAFYQRKKDSKRFFEMEFSFAKHDKKNGVISRSKYNPIDSTFATIYHPVSAKNRTFGLRVEFGKWRKTFYDEKIKLGWSTSFRSFVHFGKQTPKSSVGFPIQNFQAGLYINFIPRIQYDFSKHFFVDLNLVINALGLSIDFETTDNPALTERQRKQGGLDFGLLAERTLRLGLGYKF